MNTKTTFVDWISDSVKAVTPIKTTLFAPITILDTHQYEYPLFIHESGTSYEVNSYRSNGIGVEKDYECHLFFYYYNKDDNFKESETILEKWADDTVAQIERNGAFIFRRASNKCHSKHWSYVGSDRVRALEVSVIYTMNTCYNLT